MSFSSQFNAEPRTPNRWSRYAWLPIPLLFAGITVLWVADLQTVYESQSLMVLLNLIFTWLASLCICILTARGFLDNGQPSLLMFGCGSLLWGSTSLAAALIVGSNVNPTITVHNLGVFGAAFCHFIGLLWCGRLQRPGKWLVFGYTGALMIAVLIYWAATTGLTPIFFVQGQGGTFIRQIVLLLAITQFAWVGLQMIFKFRRQSGAFYYWYGLGLALVATGLTGVMLLTVQGGIMGWTNRLTQYLGSAYLFIAALLAVQETGSWRIHLTDLENAGQKFNILADVRRQTPFVRVLRYVFAVVVVIIAFGLRIIFESLVGLGLPTYITFYPAIMAIVFVLGFGPGILSTILMAFIADYWILPPVGEFYIASPVDRLGLAIFSGTNLVMCIIAEMFKRAREKAAAYDRETALRESEAKYRNLFENMTEEVHFWKLVRDEEGRIMTWMLVDANPPTLKSWGRTTLDEIKGKTTDEIFGLGATEHYMPVVQKIMTESVPYVFEDYFPHLDKYFKFTSVPLGDYFITTGADVTDIKKAELALRESEERFRVAQELSPDGFTILRPVRDALGHIEDFTWVYENATIARLTGTDQNAVVGRRLLELLPGHAQSPFHEAYIQVAETGEPRVLEASYHGDSIRTNTWFRVAVVPIGRDIAILAQNITTRKQAEEDLRQQSEAALRLSEREFRSLAEAMPQIVWATRPDGWNIYFNQQWVDYTGLTMEESYGHGWNTPFHPDDKPRAWDAWQRATQQNERYSLECRLRSADGVYRWWLVRGEPMRGANGEILKWFGTCTDIEELKGAEKGLHEANTLLEQRVAERTAALRASVAEKEVMLKEIHHRVKNNLQVISSLVGLQTDGSKNEAVRQVLQDVTYRVRSMALVHEKLYQSADLAHIDFAEYTRSLLSYLWRAHGAAAAAVRLTLDLEQVSLPADTAVTFGLILNELAVNSLKHAFQGRAYGEVTISLQSGTDRQIRLSVADNGVGMPVDFDWLQTQSLGLRLVQMLSRQLDAAVEVSGGNGTRFVIAFGCPDSSL